MSTKDLCESTMAAKDLPKDIIIDILSRLPVKSLVRFCCLCKTWYSLLKNPNFISKHFHQIDRDRSVFLFNRSNFNNNTPTNRSITLLSGDESFDMPLNIDIPFLKLTKPMRISGSCNGFVCLSVMPIACIIILWNPVTREFKDLPVSQILRPRAGPIKVVLAFGFDSISNDYKVLRIVHYCYPLKQIEMYSLSTNSWKEIKADINFLIFEPSCRVFVRGKFHWTALAFGGSNSRELIVSFDMGAEVFNQFPLPDFSRGDDGSDDEEEDHGKLGWHLVAWKESLGLIVYPNHSPNKKFDVWVMNEYGVAGSWTKYLSIGPYPRVDRPLGRRPNGEILLHKNKGELVLYDPRTQELKNFPGHEIAYCSEVFNHVESLLQIKGGKVLSEANLNAVVPDLFFVRKIDLNLEL